MPTWAERGEIDGRQLQAQVAVDDGAAPAEGSDACRGGHGEVDHPAGAAGGGNTVAPSGISHGSSDTPVPRTSAVAADEASAAERFEHDGHGVRVEVDNRAQ